MSNVVGSTIQITTLPLPVLSTLQAVRITISVSGKLSIVVGTRFQFCLRFAHSRRALYSILACGNDPGFWRCHTDRHLRGHWRASTHTGSATGSLRASTIRAVDGGSSYSCRCHHPRSSSTQGLESISWQHATHATDPRHGLWLHQWNTFSSFSSRGQVGRRTPGSDHL